MVLTDDNAVSDAEQKAEPTNKKITLTICNQLGLSKTITISCFVEF